MPHQVEILAVTKDTHETLKFTVERPENYQFSQGQATDVALDRDGHREDKHPFTFTSLPDDPCLEFTIKTYPDRDGMTEAMRSLQVGDKLLIENPWGAIEFKGPGIFIAGGAGITPFLAIFRDLHRKGKLEGNHLLYSNARQNDIIAAAELKTRFGPHVHFYLTDDEVPNYQKGHIDEGVLRGVLDLVKPGLCYVCGTPGMTEEIVSALKNLGMSDDQIVTENA